MDGGGWTHGHLAPAHPFINWVDILLFVPLTAKTFYVSVCWCHPSSSSLMGWWCGVVLMTRCRVLSSFLVFPFQQQTFSFLSTVATNSRDPENGSLFVRNHSHSVVAVVKDTNRL